MARLCINCLLAEAPCSAAHLLAKSSRRPASGVHFPTEAPRPRQSNTTVGLKDQCEF
jgi:hypothetical protein